MESLVHRLALIVDAERARLVVIDERRHQAGQLGVVLRHDRQRQPEKPKGRPLSYRGNTFGGRRRRDFVSAGLGPEGESRGVSPFEGKPDSGASGVVGNDLSGQHSNSSRMTA